MTPEAAIAAAMLLPVVAAALVVLTGRSRNVRDTGAALVSTLTFACVSTLVPEVAAGATPRLEVMQVLPGIQLAFEVEPLGMLSALVASGLWVLTHIYAVGYMRGHHEENQTRFFTFFCLAISAALGIAFAANLFTLFLFYEALTFSTFPLVAHHGSDRAKKAGRVYLGILVSTSVGFLLLAIVWTYVAAGTMEFALGGILEHKLSDADAGLVLALYAFGTGKAALMPFHRWLPNAMVAPTPVSALLHAVAVVKAGVFTVLKVTVYVFGLDYLHRTGLSLWLMYAASATLLIAAVIAIGRDNLKERLAYSTISHLSYIVLGAALATPAGAVGGGLHIAMHAVAKITLFFCAGAIMVASHKTQVSELDGIGRQMPITMSAFLLGSLSLIGLPPFGGAWSKWFLALGAAQSHHIVFVGVLMLSSLLGIGYLLPVAAKAFFRAPKATPGHPESDAKEAPVLCLLPLSITAVGSLLIFFFADSIHALLAPIVRSPG